MEWIKWYLKGFVNMFGFIGTILLIGIVVLIIFVGATLTFLLVFRLVSPNELHVIHKVTLALFLPCLALLFTERC